MAALTIINYQFQIELPQIDYFCKKFPRYNFPIVTNRPITPSARISVIPVLILLAGIGGVILTQGAGEVLTYAPLFLLLASFSAFILARQTTRRYGKAYLAGLKTSARQIAPALPILFLIGTIAATWMLSGLVPTLISYGLGIISEKLFLVIACAICAAISVLSGSSWTTIATIGVAFMGIGKVMGYSDGWIAGAIISGAYFGDKISPLSDTTVLASSSCEVPLFTHIRYLTYTTIPAMAIALLIFFFAGETGSTGAEESASETISALSGVFTLSPWLLVIPAVTGLLIALRINTLITLTVSTGLGLAAIFIFQPDIVTAVADSGSEAAFRILFSETSVQTGSEMLDSLITTRGITGMLPTVFLVICAGIFGGTMLGTGMLRSITSTFCRYVRSPRKIVGSTIFTGLFMNAVTADQFLSIVILGNLFKNAYKRARLQPRLLSRTVEDSVSVTSVLVPWGSCGVTQATVLGVPTLTYLPYCFFNWLTPLVSLTVIYLGIRTQGIARRAFLRLRTGSAS